MNTNREIAILDFGSQYTHLIARRVRELGVIARIYPTDVPASQINTAWGIILSGSPQSVLQKPTLPYDPAIFGLGLPILGLCYGHQLIAKHFGGTVGSGTAREYGRATVTVGSSPIFKGIPRRTVVWMSHGDHVSTVPPGFHQIADSGGESVAAMANEEKRLYSFQFHPEVNHTRDGQAILSNFVFNICHAEKNWDKNKILQSITEEIRSAAGDKNVFLLVSGGVDSTVCFALLEKILGKKRVYGLHVDHGLMRQDESTKIVRALHRLGFDNLHVHNGTREFLKRLKGSIEPEEKRKIIGETFLDIVDNVMAKNNMVSGQWLVGQGTIYPDTIESGGTKNAVVIKTHHNRVPRIQQMIAAGKIIEPLKELYKDEVRAIGRQLHLPAELIDRHPFPGPGLGIRILCSKGSSQTAVPLADSSLPGAKLYRLPIKSVGVQGDERSYAHPAIIIPENAAYRKKIWKELPALAPGITNRHREVNRVIMVAQGDETKIPLSCLYAATLSPKRIKLLQKIDAVVNRHILSSKSCRHIWQLPVVLVPFGYRYKESVVLRPVESEEAMTLSFAMIPAPILTKILATIARLHAVDFVLYDVTNKPPGTIEWE